MSHTLNHCTSKIPQAYVYMTYVLIFQSFCNPDVCSSVLFSIPFLHETDQASENCSRGGLHKKIKLKISCNVRSVTKNYQKRRIEIARARTCKNTPTDWPAYPGPLVRHCVKDKNTWAAPCSQWSRNSIK